MGRRPKIDLDLPSLDLVRSVENSLTKKVYSVVEFAEDLCERKLYPRQALLLKLIFLETLSQHEEDVLDYWISGGRGDSEILISPLMRERISWLREREYPHFREIVLVGGRRCSKGYVTGIAMAYKMFQFMQGDPAKEYGIDEDKEIYFPCISASQDQAKRYQYADFSSTVTSCSLMQPNIHKVRELEFSVMTEADKRKILELQEAGTRVGRDISTLRGLACAANASTLRGMAGACFCMDEMAHMQQEGESSMTAAQVYDAVMPSLAQFGKGALIFCNSSPYTKIGKFYERHTEALAVKDDKPLSPMMFTLRMPSWALFEGYHKDKKKRFRKAITASPDWDPDAEENGIQIFSAEDKDNIVIERENERQDPDKFKVERRAQWAEVMDAFLRPELVDRAFLGKPLPSGQYIPMKSNWSRPEVGYRYIAHLDPSSTTAGFGFALAHVEYMDRINPDTQEIVKTPHVVYDIVQRWRAASFDSGIVDYQIVLNDIMQYLIIFRPAEVSLDQFQNAAIIGWLNKELRERNMQSIKVFERTATNKTNWNVASVFRDALAQDLLHFPSDTSDCDWLGLELKNLQQINTAGQYPRVEHPTVGPVQSKDMWSSASQVCYALIGEQLAGQVSKQLGEMHMALGAPEGFSIGNKMRRHLPKPTGATANAITSHYQRDPGQAINDLMGVRRGTWVGGRRGTRRGGRRF